ncbi:hypothetical protein [Spirosoma linguale]|uniref:Uncharacterized protein n=1 Tax=Spirosoma linguale (strain ATCC 33905 / DSM 74 / LMG 10896 / Claus 1) TaxID=504472 RepID=D2QVU0_SPILD|nr:hypothetical protein Slin_6978 [Spirosoma linguale DSM 74]
MVYNFDKLTTDVRAAMKAGREFAAEVDDGGTYNVDGVLLKIPRIREAKVVQALAKAGVRTQKRKWGWRGTGYMLNPGVGQAHKKETACEAIFQHLRKAGHVVCRYLQPN